MVIEYSHTVNVLREVEPERPGFVVLAKLEDQILLGLLASSDGAISGLVHIAPGPFVGLVRAFEKSDLTEVAELHRRVRSQGPRRVQQLLYRGRKVGDE